MFVFLSCSSKNTSTADDVAPPDDASAASYEEKAGGTYYYDFNDILVPLEMELDPDNSFVIETPSEKSGLMIFSGKVEFRSLTDFFVNNMQSDGWRLLSSLRSSRTIVIFEKDTRYCIMSITNSKFDTGLEIWISPRSSGATY